MQATSAERTVLGSLWDGLNEHLIASFYEVDRQGNPIGNVTVRAPLTDANLEMTFGWSSMFENAGMQNVSPAIANMVASGVFQPMTEVIKTGNGGWVDGLLDKAEKTVKQFEGRTGITKLNSTQVFTGMQPVKIPVTALFRAWRDPQMEVELPFEQLMRWALPIELAPDGSIIARAIAAARGKGDIIDAPLPSKSPTMIAMSYKGRTYGPLVIESISQPLSSPIDDLGKHPANPPCFSGWGIWQPAMRQQFADPTVGLSRQARQNVLQIGEGVVAIQLGRLDQAHDGGRPLAGAQAAGK